MSKVKRKLKLSIVKYKEEMSLLKKWKFYLLGLVLLASCKSADCGCPMADVPEITKDIPKTYHKVIDTD